MCRQNTILPSLTAVLVALLTLSSGALQAQENYKDCKQADPQQRTQCIQKTLSYTSEQYNKVARVICSRIDRYKQMSSTAFPIRQAMCPAIPDMCNEGRKYLDMGGIVRATVAQGFKLKDSNLIEDTIPPIMSELLSYPCDVKSVYALSDVPFHQQKRNFMKRAIFTGQVTSMFNQFLFNEYGYEKTTGGKAVAWDINAVEIVDGEPETLLDYVDKALAPDHNVFLGEEQRGNVRDLWQDLRDRGAVNARDLDCKPGQKTWCSRKK